LREKYSIYWRIKMDPKQNGLIQEITLACLLHDIGKVIQRAENDYRRNHSDIGAGYVEKLPGISGLKPVIESIKFHHQKALEGVKLPENHPAFIVCEADNIASGTDRREIDENNSKNFQRDMPLHSVFNLLGNTDLSAKDRFAHHLKIPDEKCNINYPVVSGKVKAPHSVYQTVVKPLLHEISKAVNNKIITGEINNLVLRILEKYCIFIPSSTHAGQMPDISLFDHSKITAAVGSSMYSYIKEEKNSEDFKHWCSSNKRKDNFFLMVSGDLSGIQDFIFTISSKRAMKSLRTRSFYLDILLEHIADEILEALDLSRANLLYTGGGHFYMLLPNTEKAIKTIDMAKEKVNSWFLGRFGTSLYLAIAHHQCSPADLMDKEHTGSSTEVFRELASSLSVEKLRRYNPAQLKSIMDPDSELNRTIDNTRECVSCRTSGIPAGGSFTISDDEDERICPICHSFAKAGKDLLRKDLVLAVTEKNHLKGDFLDLPSIDENCRYLNFSSYDQLRTTTDKIRRAYSKNETSLTDYPSINLWMGDYMIESEDGDLITFEEMEAKSCGIRRLAAMRADVDNLGSVFSGGLDKKYATLSRYAALSRNLSMFFKWYINKFCKGDLSGEGTVSPENFRLDPFTSLRPDYKGRNMAIVYSGGDDVFVVGAWNDVMEFALDLKHAFELFTCEKLTFSAGIGFFGRSFPVSQMAKLTGDLEKQAKNNPGKNSVSLFGKDKTVNPTSSADNSGITGHTYSWEEFENGVFDKVKFFLKYFNITERDKNKLTVSKAFLYRLLKLLESGSDKSGMNIAKLAYNLARVEQAARDKNNGDSSDYGLLKNSIYNWAIDRTEAKALITAVNLIIYMFREPETNERKGKDE
jgi:CRISPR-associated protein Csm1